MADANIHGLTTLSGAGIDLAADEVPVWDNSAATAKRVTIDQFAVAIFADLTQIALSDGQVVGKLPGGVTSGVSPFAFPQPITTQTGTTYTIAATDVGSLVLCSNASAITVTVPQDSDVVFAIGCYVELYQLGAGQLTVAQGSGATLHDTPTAKSRAQYSRLFLQKISANSWALSGDIAAT